MSAVGRRLKLRTVAAVLIGVICLYAALTVIPPKKNYPSENPLLKDGDLPIIVAHRGGRDEFPQNTLEAFYNAYSIDKNVIMETDVNLTKDGVLILLHNELLDATTNVTGLASDWNYTDLISERVDFGYTNKTKSQKLVEGSELVKFKTDDGREVTPLDVTYPEGVAPRDSEIFLATTLEELILAFPNNRINVEIKQSGELGKAAFAEILRILEETDSFDRVVLASFHSEIYDEFCRYQKEGLVPEGFMYSPGTSGAARYLILYLLGLDIFFTDGMCVFQIPTDQYGINLMRPDMINNAHRHNLAVHYWTIDDKETMRKLIDIGADGIMTNYPHILKEVLDERAQRMTADA
jgi:glycerophosphoryl diester phosphodiesterase